MSNDAGEGSGSAAIATHHIIGIKVPQAMEHLHPTLAEIKIKRPFGKVGFSRLSPLSPASTRVAGNVRVDNQGQ